MARVSHSNSPAIHLPGKQLDSRDPPTVAIRRLLAKIVWKGLRWSLPNHHMRIPTDSGRVYLNLRESRMMLFRAFRVYEYWTRQLLKRLLSPGATALDVGANKGDYTLLFARSVSDEGKVLAFEPDPRNLRWLRKTIAANACSEVRIREYALSDQSGTTTFYPGQMSGWGSLVRGHNPPPPERQPFKVQTKSLDEVLAGEGITDVDLMKIDVEGGELLVLRGAQRLLKDTTRLKIVMDVDVRGESERAELLELLRSNGFHVFSVGADLIPLETLEPSVRTVLAIKANSPGTRPKMGREADRRT